MRSGLRSANAGRKTASTPAAPPNANNARRFIRTRSRGSDLAGAELFGKPIPTFPDHALGSSAAAIAAAPARLRLPLEDVAVEDRRDTEIRHINQLRDIEIDGYADDRISLFAA